jgi:hypothetical protein
MKNLILIFITSFCFSQKGIILDSWTFESIPFSIIEYDNQTFYSDVNGIYIFNKNIKDTIKIVSANYEIKKITIFDLIKTDTILLTPKSIVLDEIILVGKNQIKIESLKKAKKFSSFPISPKNEIGLFIKPTHNDNNYIIKSLTFPINSSLYNKSNSELKNKIGVLRINIYKESTEINNIIYTSKPINYNMNNKEELKIILEDNIQLDNKGLYIGIELIGIQGDNNSIDENSSTILRPVLTNENVNEFDIQSYYRKINSMTNLNLNELIQKNTGENKNYNLSFGMTYIIN